MIKKNNKACIVCGTRYTFCLNCAEFDNEPRWRAIYHDDNCKKIDNTISEYLAGNMSAEDAKNELDKCDLSNKESFHKTIRAAIDKLYAPSKKVTSKKPRKIVDESVDEQEIE